MLLAYFKKNTSIIRVAIFYGDAHPDKDDKSFENSALMLPSRYTNTFEEYCEIVNSWLNYSGKEPNGKEHKYEFNTIDYSEFDSERVYAKYYRKENAAIRSFLKNAVILPLNKVASIKNASVDLTAVTVGKPRLVKMINNKRPPEYPFDPERDTVTFPATTERVHKGDIVAYSNFRGFYLIDEEPSFDLYAEGTIIKAKEVSPEYLYLYLTSNTAKRIWDELTIYDGSRICLFDEPITDLDDTAQLSVYYHFPVVIPNKPNSYYVTEFNNVSVRQK